jgi:hypothetical protein
MEEQDKPSNQDKKVSHESDLQVIFTEYDHYHQIRQKALDTIFESLNWYVGILVFLAGSHRWDCADAKPG